MKRPDILLVTADQLRPWELGCYGGARVATPGIDRIAARGTRWELAITNFPVCMAARSVLMSGQYNRTATGGRTNIAYAGRDGDFAMPEYPYSRRPHLPDPTLAELLRGAGYGTWAIGKWHIHSWPHEIGFDHYLIPRVHHAHSAQVYTRDGGPEFAPPGWSLDFEVDAACELLASRARASDDSPTFLYLNLSPPHCPVADIPEEYRTLYDPATVPLRENVSEADIVDRDYWYRVYRWDFRYYSFHLPHTETLPDGYDIHHLTAEYCGAVTWMDSAVGRVLDALEASGRADDTIVLFCSDHGENLGSHGLVQKGTANDESVRVPLVMAGPSIARGECVQGSVASLVDLLPTLVELAGLEVPAHAHGRSLRAEAVCGEGVDAATAYFETVAGAGLRSPTHTCLVPWTGPRRLGASADIVYDDVADPFQHENLATRTDGGADPVESALVAEVLAFDASTPWSDLEDG